MNRFLAMTLGALCALCATTHLHAQVSDDERLDVIRRIAKEFHQKEQEFNSSEDIIPNKDGFSPGRYTILWDEARLTNTSDLFCISLPITPQHRYIAHRTDKKGRAYSVEVVQKLNIYTNRRSNKTFEYLITFIPDKSYIKSSRKGWAERFTPYDPDKSISGITLNTNVTHGHTTQYMEYVDGVNTKKLFVRNSTSSQSAEEREQMAQLIEAIDFELISSKGVE